MEKIKARVMECTRCDLHKSKTNYVFGEGNEKAKVMFIGEAPGHNEDKEGRPFAGRTGEVFDEMLGSVNLDRGDVYITNVIKCRPPNNRKVSFSEIDICTTHIKDQINFIGPEIIVTLGNNATDFVFKLFNIKNKKRISEIHGKNFFVSTLSGHIVIMPMYHPSMATYNPEMKKVLLKDMRVFD